MFNSVNSVYINMIFWSVMLPSHGNGFVCRFYCLCAPSKSESVNIIADWTSYLWCLLGILLILYLQYQRYGQGKILHNLDFISSVNDISLLSCVCVCICILQSSLQNCQRYSQVLVHKLLKKDFTLFVILSLASADRACET